MEDVMGRPRRDDELLVPLSVRVVPGAREALRGRARDAGVSVGVVIERLLGLVARAEDDRRPVPDEGAVASEPADGPHAWDGPVRGASGLPVWRCSGCGETRAGERLEVEGCRGRL